MADQTAHQQHQSSQSNGNANHQGGGHGGGGRRNHHRNGRGGHHNNRGSGNHGGGGRHYYHNRQQFNNNLRIAMSMIDNGDPESQRKRLEEQLKSEAYECLVCCEEIARRQTIYSCSSCYNVFHLECIKRWARSSQTEAIQQQPTEGPAGWRCPACQHTEIRIPERYFCFCGRRRNPADPPVDSNFTPHSCTAPCVRKKDGCTHRCRLLCHPGPCPPCDVKVTKSCRCGSTSLRVACSSDQSAIICQKPCQKKLQCNQHFCFELCCGSCKPCPITINQKCYCGKEERTVGCSSEEGGREWFSCLERCDRLLSCGIHRCEKICHESECLPCALSPAVVTHCPCGQVALDKLPFKTTPRTKCTDRIPTCGKICSRTLSCGPPDSPHTCQRKCHNGPCEPCPEKTTLRCRCGANAKTVPCSELADHIDLETNPSNREFFCERRCNRKLTCGRHKCPDNCCKDQVHDCNQVCGKRLVCGAHNCNERCHKGSCGPCWNVSWDELYCHCGYEKILPPINCGTKPPKCDRLCTREHPCNHPVDHKCHSEISCPVCTVIVTKPCYGGHGRMTSVLCHIDGVSCGKQCSKIMDCGLHTCQRVCHENGCSETGCTYPCTRPRSCGHPCALPCHESTSPKVCPSSKCRVMSKVTCACGRITDQMACYQINDANNRMTASLMAKLRLQETDTLDVSTLIKKAQENKYARLECDDICSQIARNKKLAEALDIKEPDPTPAAPSYPETVKQFAMENLDFAKQVHDQFTSLVKEAKSSRMPFRNHNFPAMRSDQRQFIHELSEFFGLKSHGVDQEPNRSVIVKALKDKCFLPTVSIMDVVSKKSSWLVLSGKSAPVRRLEPAMQPTKPVVKEPAWQSKPAAAPPIDYFDYNGD